MKRITLCGSTKFKKEFEVLNKQLTLEGDVVHTVAIFGHSDDIDLTHEQKEVLDGVHRAKIDNSDAILVINVDGYIGESTRKEIVYAQNTGKIVKYLSDFPDLTCLCDSATMNLDNLESKSSKMKTLEDYIRDKSHLETVGSFTELGYDFSHDDIMKGELNKFKPEEIKDLYLERFNPVLHFKMDKNDDDFNETAFQSLINWYHY